MDDEKDGDFSIDTHIYYQVLRKCRHGEYTDFSTVTEED